MLLADNRLGINFLLFLLHNFIVHYFKLNSRKIFIQGFKKIMLHNMYKDNQNKYN